MSLFGRVKDERSEEILGSIRALSREVAELRGQKEALKTNRDLEDSARELRVEIETLKIEKGRKEESHAREKREVEHMVGLQKKRAEQERDLAVKTAQLEVREGNLAMKENAFEERLENVTQQLKDQIEYLRTDIISQILQRLPTFEVKTALEPHRLLSAGRSGNNGDNGEGD